MRIRGYEDMRIWGYGERRIWGFQMAARYAANKQIHWKKSEAAFRGILDRVDCAAGRLVGFQSGKVIYWGAALYTSHHLVIHPIPVIAFLKKFEYFRMINHSASDRVTVEGFVQTMEKHGIEVTHTVSQQWLQPMLDCKRNFIAESFLRHPYMKS